MTANAVARIWGAVLQILMTPIIVRLLGPDSYGLVGFSASVSLFLVFLDQCVSPTLARELARSGPVAGMTSEQAVDLRDLLRTLEVVSGIMAVFVGGLVVMIAPWIARHGLSASQLPETTVMMAVRLIGLGIAVQWPAMLYSGGCMGLQRQDLLVVIRLVIGTIQSVGAVLLLSNFQPSIELFLGWTALAGAVTSAATGVALWRIMPSDLATEGNPSRRPRIELERLRHVWRFAAGSLLIGLTSALLTQGPALIVAKYCTLAQLAAYSLSMSLAQQVSTLLTAPVIATLVPHFTQLMAANDEVVLAREYHRWTQIIVALLLPVAATLIVFARPLMELWLGTGAPLVAPVSLLLPWVVAGTVLNTLVTPPYVLQMARGWTRQLVKMNSAVVVLIMPALFMLTPEFGPKAVALCWIVINSGYYLFYAPFVHHRLLPGENFAWWCVDTLAPILTTIFIYFVAAVLLPQDLTAWSKLAWAAFTAGLTGLVLLAILPYLRSDAVRLAQGIRRTAAGVRLRRKNSHDDARPD